MKKIGIIIALFISVCFSANAQRHIKGIKSVDVLGGISGVGYFGEGGYAQYFSNKFYFTGRLRYEMAKVNDSINFGSYAINLAGNYTFWNPGEGFFLNATAGGSIALNSMNKQDFESLSFADGKKQNTISGGVFLGLESEIFFGNRVVWIVNFRQQFNIKNDSNMKDADGSDPIQGRFAYYAGTGLRFNIF